MRVNALSADKISVSTLIRSSSIGRNQMLTSAECSLISVIVGPSDENADSTHEPSGRLLAAGHVSGFPASSTFSGGGGVRPFCKVGKKMKVLDSLSLSAM